MSYLLSNLIYEGKINLPKIVTFCGLTIRTTTPYAPYKKDPVTRFSNSVFFINEWAIGDIRNNGLPRGVIDTAHQ
jgi:hypothetical protein